MKKFLSRILLMAFFLIIGVCQVCYADLLSIPKDYIKENNHKKNTETVTITPLTEETEDDENLNSEKNTKTVVTFPTVEDENSDNKNVEILSVAVIIIGIILLVVVSYIILKLIEKRDKEDENKNLQK